MTSGFETDTDRMSRDISRIDSCLTSLKNAGNKAFSAVNEADTMWDGPANSAFNAHFKNDYDRFNEIIRAIRDYNKSLEKAKAEYDKCENNVVSMTDSMRI